MDQLAVLNAGSPPRMRGKALDIVLVVHPQGITPAYAGKRPDFGGTASQARDHPRVCGEKFFGKSTQGAELGSPPRMRGKVPSTSTLHPYSGITPAYAGKSIARRISRPSTGDHPRVCGEKLTCSGGVTADQGSPPRMRGKVLHSPAAGGRIGITPAYAGKSICGMPNRNGGRDHPRVCGEKWTSLQYRVQAVGSPPRMRGKD